jgi:hypothetical protein
MSFAVIVTLLAGDGLARDLPTASADPTPVGIVPAVDVPSKQFSNTPEGQLGGQAARIEFDDADLNASMSAWYRLAYVQGGTRLRAYDHYAVTTQHPDPAIVRSEKMAWRMANRVVGALTIPDIDGELPRSARIHTGIDTGPSAGLMFTLAYLDALTPGPLVGDLRVAGTGLIGLDGVVGPVSEIDVKIAAARLTRPDVIFTPKPPESTGPVTIVESQHTRYPADPYTVGQWLNVGGYQQAGALAANHPGTTAIVVVHDLRQALAWLCGRTNNADTCSVASAAANLPIGTQGN